MEAEQRRCLWAPVHRERCHYFEVDLAQRLVLYREQRPTATRPTAASVVTGRFLRWLITSCRLLEGPDRRRRTLYTDPICNNQRYTHHPSDPHNAERLYFVVVDHTIKCYHGYNFKKQVMGHKLRLPSWSRRGEREGPAWMRTRHSVRWNRQRKFPERPLFMNTDYYPCPGPHSGTKRKGERSPPPPAWILLGLSNTSCWTKELLTQTDDVLWSVGQIIIMNK